MTKSCSVESLQLLNFGLLTFQFKYYIIDEQIKYAAATG